MRSLQLSLAIRLAVVYVAATALVLGILVYQAYDTAGSLDDRELSLRAEDLARSVTVDSGGSPHLDLPPRLAAAYMAAGGADVFAIRDAAGHLIAASPTSFGARVAGWPPATEEPSYFRLNDPGSGTEGYYGLSIAVESAAGPLAISVARTAGAEALIHSLLREFVLDIGWIIPLIVAMTLAIGILAIRSGLKPVRVISQKASAIGPGATSIRLPDTHLPSEITPLVSAVNDALDRLEQGFAIQRQFTANAAHELRTPLAIITGALEAMEGNAELAALRNDVARMNRLVEQLLEVARLDAVLLDVSARVNLNDIAASVVAAMAPWAIAQHRSLALAVAAEAVEVKGNAQAIMDALRNLIENAIAHSPRGEEVMVSVYRDGSVSVADRGPGVPMTDRDRIFERFWRGKGAETRGAGLGLAIVKEIAKAHNGRVGVGDNPGGGAIFTLSLPRDPLG